jgi:ribosomal protein S20
MSAAVRNVRQSPSQAAAQENLKKAIVVLDRLARKGIIHQNSAANQKSRLSQFIRTLPA